MTPSDLLDHLTQTQQAFVKELMRHEVRFVVVGGAAVIFHASPDYDRMLDDLDVLIDASKENLDRLEVALKPLGTENIGRIASADRPEVKITWRDAEAFTSMTDFTFGEVSERASVLFLKGKELRVMSREDVIKAKRLAYQAPDREGKRDVDLRDLNELAAS
jgi:predicted type IV restriction endonuclease